MNYDIIGDIHGCYDELAQLFDRLGYEWKKGIPIHPEGRVPVFLGDLTDRGPQSLKVVALVYDLVVSNEKAHYVPGNHCNKLYRFFQGNPVKETHGLETTTAEYRGLPDREKERIRQQFMTLYEVAPLYLELKDVHAVVAHAGIRGEDIGQVNKRVQTFVLYGDITGEKLPDGRPLRRDWAQDYGGNKWIVYGHTPTRTPRFVHKTVNIDTGCVFGGALTAFSLPEETITSVPSSMPVVEEKFRY